MSAALTAKYSAPGRSMFFSSEFHRCQCVSTNPGMTIIPAASMRSAPGALIAGAIATMRPLRTWTSPRGKSGTPFAIATT
jgi:hypothetical protein